MRELEEPMKRILIVNNNMHIGGVQKALVNLLCEIHNDYEITLLLFYAGGELLSKIPEDVKVMAANAPFRCWGMTRSDAGALKDKVVRGFWAAAVRVLGREAVFSLPYPFQKGLEEEEYDAAISYLHSGPLHMFYGGCNEFVLRCVNAKKRSHFYTVILRKYMPRLPIMHGYISNSTGSRPVRWDAEIPFCALCPIWRIKRWS